MRSHPLFAGLVLALSLAACGPRAEPGPTPEPADAGDRTVGTVRVVGSAPMNTRVVMQPAAGGSIQLTGPLGDELRLVPGAEVAVTGVIEPAPDPLADRQIRVAGYEILSIAGEPVITGTVEGSSGGWTLLRTPSGELVYLSGAARLEAGQKVWVQGPSALIVQSHGVLVR